MDEDRRLSIRRALLQYQEVVQEHNILTLNTIVDYLTSLSRPGVSEQLADVLNVRALEKFLNRLPRRISEPREVFELDLQLDGVCHQSIQSRQAWLSAIRAEMDTDMNVTFPPPELDYLCSITNVIRGPGLPWWQMTRGIDVLSRWNMPEIRVALPMRNNAQDIQLEPLLGPYEITVGVRIGDKDQGNGGTYAVYCSKAGDDWSWRYAVIDEEWASDIFDSLEEYLEYFGRLGQPTTEEAIGQAIRWSKLL